MKYDSPEVFNALGLLYNRQIFNEQLKKLN